MAKDTVIQRSFGGGELAPVLHARADLVKYATGLRTCRNFFVMKGGGVSNRGGTRYRATCKTASPDVMLMPYLSEIAGESVLLEVGVGYIRFFVNGAALQVNPAPAAWSALTTYAIGDLVESGGVYYYAVLASLNQAPPNATFWYAMPGTLLELPNPYTSSNLFPPYWSQSGRTLTLTHPDVPAHELVFVNLNKWILRPIVTEPTLAAPTNVVLTPGAAGTRRYAYRVTAAAAETYEESPPSGQVINTGAAEPTEDLPHALTWDVVPGAAEYYIYGDPYDNGIYGFLGTAISNSFKDPGFVPDFNITPPIARTPFNAVNKYPSISANYQQRRILANTRETPDAIFTSRIGFPSNFGISSPLQDDDALTFRIAGNNNHPVRHALGLKAGLIVLTDGGEWTVKGGPDGALTPSAINADQETYVGAYKVKPVVVGNSIIYVQARGSIPRDLRFDQEVEGLAGRDLSVFSEHLVKHKKMRAVAYAQDPDSIVWMVRDDGVLLGMTYLREQDVWGWHRHNTGQNASGGSTDGFFWDVCVVPEEDGDAVYFIVRRTINGATVRYIEKLERFNPDNFDATCFFVDAGLSYSGAPANNVAGLTHLRGEVCAVVGDGAVIFDGDRTRSNAADFTVTAGGTFPVNFPASYSNIHVGLPIRYAELETLDLDVQGDVVLRDKKKRVQGLYAVVEKSARTFKAGTSSAANLRPIQLGPHESPTADAFSGIVDLSIDSHFDEAGRVFIRHTDPLPLTVLAIIPIIDLGG